ncbi:GDP-L-fucose synthase family protein [Gallalistipes aquisgranensis]|uniref:GDP-L-fucose synthase family protein n=1 Tax=Gallalistipes aquisgranensis TaxID=2779358 RepID=UPI001CF8A36E|nr:GDP-L-fucose synthase [Gallalistipes aquisgranensis]MBE5033451.1 GDP-L-fucose synthase [Gallalistipes aquisgranensis]
MDRQGKIYVAGHRGLVGSAIEKNLREKGYTNIVTRTHAELDLTDQAAVARFFAEERPDYVFVAAARVGGIMANSIYRGQFIYENIVLAANIIHHAWLNGAKKLLFLGSTCIYPREAPQPMPEDCLLTSPLEYTNEPYAVSKIAGMKMCEAYNMQYGTDFIAVMPTNLYGPNDNFDLERSHVLPALIRKMHLGHALERGDEAALRADFDRMPVGRTDGGDLQAVLAEMERYGIRRNPSTGRVEVEIWGTGTPLREFLWSEDMADACVWIMEHVGWADLSRGMKEPRNCHINIGTGKEVSIRTLAETIARKVGFGGDIVFDPSKPDGTMRKLTDPSKLHALGWTHRMELDRGIETLYDWYLKK